MSEENQSNPLDAPGTMFVVELLNPNPSSRRTKDGPVYRISFEVSQEVHASFMNAAQGNLRIAARMSVIPDTDEQPAYDAIMGNGKPKKKKEPKGPYSYFWEYLHPRGRHGGNGFVTIPGVLEAIEAKRKSHKEDVWKILHRVFDVDTLAVIGPDQVFAKFPADKHPPALKIAIERAMNHQKEREATVEYGNDSNGDGEDQAESSNDSTEEGYYVE